MSRSMRLRDAVTAGDTTTSPPFLDVRFTAEGAPIKDNGLTVIRHIKEYSQNEALAHARDALRLGPHGAAWAWLPPSSYHMTIFDLVTFARRAPERWPEGLSVDADEEMVANHLFERLRRFRMASPPPFRVRPVSLYCGMGGFGVAVKGADEKEEKRLRALRDRLATTTGLAHRLGHDDYAFHITLAYQVAWPDDVAAVDAAIDEAEAALIDAAPIFTLGKPEVCRFHDMTAFSREFFLR